MIKKIKSYPGKVDWSKGVYMPISMNNRLLKDAGTLFQILTWIFQKTDRLTGIMGDYLHRHNIMILGESEEKAIAMCTQMGEELAGVLTEQMKNFPDKKLIIKFSKEFYHEKGFEQRLSLFNNKYDTNRKFSHEIDFLIHQFLERQGNVSWSEKQLQSCKSYLLEELVIFELMAESGHEVNVYPGKQLRVLKNIVTGKMPSVSNELEKIYLVEMKFTNKHLTGLVKSIIEKKQ